MIKHKMIIFIAYVKHELFQNDSMPFIYGIDWFGKLSS